MLTLGSTQQGRARTVLLTVIAAWLAFPAVGVGTDLAVFDRGHIASVEHSRVADAHCHHSCHGGGGIGHGGSCLLGLVYRPRHRYSDCVWGAANCHLGPWDVRHLMESAHATPQCRAHCRSALHRSHAPVDALGRHVLGGDAQCHVHHGTLSSYQKPSHPAPGGADTRRMPAVMRPRCALF